MNKGDPISLVHQILAKDRRKLGSTSSMHSFPKHLTTFPGLLKSSELTFKQKLFLQSPSPPTPTSLLEFRSY